MARKRAPRKKATIEQELQRELGLPIMWRPEERDRDDVSKRQLPHFNPLGSKKWKAFDLAVELPKLVADMGPGIELSKEQLEGLQIELGGAICHWQLNHERKEAPRPGEIAEAMRSMQTHCEGILRILEYTRIDEQLTLDKLTNPPLRCELNPHLLDILVPAAVELGTPETMSEKLADNMVRASICMAFFFYALAGKSAAVAEKLSSARYPSLDNMHSIAMAELYKRYFRKKPTLSNDGPWVKFLAATRLWCGFQLLSNEALRKKPIE